MDSHHLKPNGYPSKGKQVEGARLMQPSQCQHGKGLILGDVILESLDVITAKMWATW